MKKGIFIAALCAIMILGGCDNKVEETVVSETSYTTIVETEPDTLKSIGADSNLSVEEIDYLNEIVDIEKEIYDTLTGWQTSNIDNLAYGDASKVAEETETVQELLKALTSYTEQLEEYKGKNRFDEYTEKFLKYSEMAVETLSQYYRIISAEGFAEKDEIVRKAKLEPVLNSIQFINSEIESVSATIRYGI